MFCVFIRCSRSYTVDASLVGAATFVVSVIEASALRAEETNFFTVSTLMILVHIASHTLEDREIFAIVEILRTERIVAEEETSLSQLFRLSRRLQLDFDDPHPLIFPEIFYCESWMAVVDFFNQFLRRAAMH